MPIDFNNTYNLVQAMERAKQPASFLLDTFFPIMPTPSVQSHIMVEYRKGGRKLAPFIVPGGRGVNTEREGSQVDIYQPPVMAARRVVTPYDIENRSFGENIYSTMSAAQRATALQAHDLNDLQNMIVNRKNKMAADILTTGKTVIKGYADDGKQVVTDTVAFDWTQEAKVSKSWADSTADIFADIVNASEMIQESAGMVPTVMICGKNVARYFLNNEKIMKWLAVPNNQNLSMMAIQPRITSPQVTRIGMIQMLNLEVYSYAETYKDDDGMVNPPPALDDVDDRDGAELAVSGVGEGVLVSLERFCLPVEAHQAVAHHVVELASFAWLQRTRGKGREAGIGAGVVLCPVPLLCSFKCCLVHVGLLRRCCSYCRACVSAY